MELRPKYYRKRRQPEIGLEAPHMTNPEEWMHFPGIEVDIAHRGEKPTPNLPVFFEELGKEDRIGYCTSSLETKKIGDVKVRRVIFHIWVNRPVLNRHNLTQSDIYAAYPHWRLGRLILNKTYNVFGVGTIMNQIKKRI
jgi:hypothetical protein